MALIDGYPQATGAKVHSVVTVIGPASYATGGFTVQAVTLGLGSIDFACVSNSDNGTHFASARFSGTTKVPPSSVLIQAFLATTGAEVAAATDLSARTFRVYALGNL